MAENIDDLSIEYVEDDKVIVKELEKNVLTRGNWTTIMFLFQEMDKKTELIKKINQSYFKLEPNFRRRK